MIKNCDTCQKNSMVRGCSECNDFDRWVGNEDEENENKALQVIEDIVHVIWITISGGFLFGLFIRVAWEFFLLLGAVKECLK